VEGSVGRVSATGEFVRDTRYLNGRITAGGRDGTLPVEPALSLGICGPEHDWRSWTFDLDPGGVA
jgi:glutathionyl-hydroquinone reductase